MKKISKVFVLIFFTGVNGDTIKDYFSVGHGLYCTGKISSSTMSPYRKGAPVSSIAVALIVLEQTASAILGTYTGRKKFTQIC
jgi:hypothetical protein